MAAENSLHMSKNLTAHSVYAEIINRLLHAVNSELFATLQNPIKERGYSVRRTSFSGSLILVWLLNLLLNFEWSVPVWILLILHFWRGWSIWFFWIAFAAWILLTIAFTLLIGWSNKYSNMPKTQQKNKNPYSAKNEDVFPTEESLAAKKRGE